MTFLPVRRYQNCIIYFPRKNVIDKIRKYFPETAIFILNLHKARRSILLKAILLKNSI